MAEWPFVRRSPANTGATTDGGPTGEPTLRWCHDAGWRVFGTPLVVGDRVFVATSAQSHQTEGAAVAIDRSSGERVWMSANEAMEVRGTPAYADGRLHLGDLDNVLFTLDAEGGRGIRSEDCGSPSPTDGVYPLVAEGTLFTQSYSLEARDPSSLERRWRVGNETGPASWGDVTLFESPVAYADGRIYAGGYRKAGAEAVFVALDEGGSPGYLHPTESFVRAVDPETGEQRWQTAIDGHPRATAVVDGTVYTAVEGHVPSGVWMGKAKPGYGDRRSQPAPNSPMPNEETAPARRIGAVHALDAKTGDERWRAELPAPARTMPACDGRYVCVGTTEGELVTLDASSGSNLWRKQVNSDYAVLSSPTIAEDGVYIGSDDDAVLAFDLRTGERLWQFDTDAGVDANAAVADGVVYIADNRGTVYAIE